MKHLCITLLLLMSMVAFSQTAPELANQPAPSGTKPVKTLPAWAYILGAGGMNSALLALKRFAPRIPGWAGPLINVGFVLGGTYLGLGQDLQSAILNTGLISGGATVAHNLVKNIDRGDALGERSIVITEGLKSADPPRSRN